MTPLPRVLVIQIGTGRKQEVAVQKIHVAGYHDQVYWLAQLRKDGQPALNRSPAGHMADLSHPQLHNYVLYDADQEARAIPIREQITQLRGQIEEQQRKLLAIYTKGEGPHDTTRG